MILNSISYTMIRNIRDTQSKRFDFYATTSTLVVTVIAIGVLFSFSVALEKEVWNADYNVYAQTAQQENENGVSSDRVTIKLDSVKFAPLTDSDINQLKVDITYLTNDPKLVNTIMAGVMKVYNADGTLVKTSTIPSGYVLGEAGPMQFATSFEDQTIQDVKAEIAMTDTSHAEKISNTLAVEASLVK
jgi:hypothetical protein